MRAPADEAAATGTGAGAPPAAPPVAASLWGMLLTLALCAGPAGAEAGNAVVIDFDQGRLILSWLGLWLVAALTFMLCADKHMRPLARLADHLRRRARQRASTRADAALRAQAQDDPRIRGGLRVAPVPGMPHHLQYLPG